MIRLTFVLRRKPELSRDEFQDYWRSVHAPLVASFATSLDILRYVQVHTIGQAGAAQNTGPRGAMEEPYDGVAELWWRNRDALAAASATEAGRAAGAALLADEARFIDLPNSPLWLNHEYPQVNPTPEDIVALPKSPVTKLFYVLRPVPGMDEEDARQYWRTNHGPIIRSWAPSMGVQRYVQVHRFADPAEEALRSTRGVTVPGYMGHAELWYDRTKPGSTGAEGRAAAEAAVEDESKFIDFSRSGLWFGKEHVIIDRR